MEQPKASDIVVDRRADGLTFTLPPLGLRRAAPGFFVSCSILFGFLIVMDGLLLATGALRDPGGIIVLVFTLIFWVAGLVGVVNGFQMGRRRTVLALDADALRISIRGPLRARHYQWPIGDITDVRVDEGDLFVFGGRRRLELQVVQKEGKPMGFLVERGDTELQWLATMLRRSLHGRRTTS